MFFLTLEYVAQAFSKGFKLENANKSEKHNQNVKKSKLCSLGEFKNYFAKCITTSVLFFF